VDADGLLQHEHERHANGERVTIDSTSTPHRWDYHYNTPTLNAHNQRLARAFLRELDTEKIASLELLAAWDEDES